MTPWVSLGGVCHPLLSPRDLSALAPGSCVDSGTLGDDRGFYCTSPKPLQDLPVLLTAPGPCESPVRGQLLSEELKDSRLEREEHFPTLGLRTETPTDSERCKEGLGSQQPRGH